MTTSAGRPPSGAATVGGTGGPPRSAALAAYIGAWVLLAAGALAWSLMSSSDMPAPAPWFVLVLGIAAAVTGVVHVPVTVRGVREATTLNELAVVPLMVLLPPGVAVATGVAAAVVAESVLTRGQLQKLAFNVAWQVTAVALGAQAYAALGPDAFVADPTGLAAAAAAAATYLAVNVVAMMGVQRIASGRGLRVLVTEEAPSGLLASTGAAVAGVLVATLTVAAPAALPVVAVLPLVDSERARARSLGHRQLARERDRFVRTVQGSSDGVVLLDRGGRVEVWNPAAARLTGVDAAAAVGASLVELSLARLDPGPQAHRAVRTALGAAVVDVSRSSGSGATVLTLRDVSHEAELARIRDDLVQRVSHEIRTPVTTVAGCLQTLQAHWDSLPEERRHDLVQAAGRGADRLGTMVANLLALARIETVADVTTERPGPCDVGTIVHEVVDTLKLDVTINVHGSASAAIHPRDLRLVVRNLLENASRYGAPPLSVDVRRDGANARLQVRDHGAGFPAASARDMFRAFSQGDDGLRRTSQGIGVGLAVVSSLVAATGGHVATRNARPGASVEVTLPAPTAGDQPV